MSEDKQVNDFYPDWNARWTKEESEKQLHSFKFNGPGWYFYQSRTLLILPTGRPDIFWFFAYNSFDPTSIFNTIANSPVQVDER